MYKVFIHGGSGTTGLRLRSRLEGREDVTLIEIEEAFRKDPNAIREKMAESDVSFFCLPDAAAIEAADVVFMTDRVEAIPEALTIARRAGVTTVFNPAPARSLPDPLRLGTFLFTPNEFEEAVLGDVPGEVVTTLGAAGCRIRSSGRTIPAVDCGAPVDSTGAGDTFTAVLAVRLAEGASLEAACAAANEAAGRSVTVRYVLPSLPRRDAAASC